MSQTFGHTPVLLEESLRLLAPIAGNRILDCTVGLGGHASAFLASIQGKADFVGLDTDAENIKSAGYRISEYPSIQLIHANFRSLQSLNLGSFDIIFADLGVSSPHFDDPDRGFSFRNDGLLDMRLDQSQGSTVATLIAESSLDDLADILYFYGEIHQSRKLAALLKQSLPQTTSALASVCEKVWGFKTKSMLPQIFQALRIAVNDELGALQVLLDTAPSMLNVGGRFGIISFHSLEDRMVKQKFRTLTTAEKDEHTGQDISQAPYEDLTRKAIKPSDAEVENNPRARSARLRVIRRCM